MERELLRLLEEPGSVLVTATRRLARALAAEVNAAQRRAGRAVWPTPEVLPLSAWLERCHEEVLDREEGPELPSAAAEQLLWEQVVAESPEGEGLLSPRGAAGAAAEAWGLLHSFEQSPQILQEPLSSEARAFAGWAAEYEARCQGHGWLDRARLPAAVAAAVGRGALPAPGRVVLAGFDQLTPQLRRLREALAARGSQVVELEPPRREARAVRVAAEDPAHELELCARWVRRCLEQEPGLRVGVVVPDLDAVREPLRRCLCDMLEPGRFTDEESALVNLSLGPPLASRALVRAALLLLELEVGPVPMATWSALLRSPYLGRAGAERGRRALLEVRLRREGDLAPSPTRVLAVCAEEAPHACPALSAALRAALVPDAAEARGALGWAETFETQLGQLGWPGDRPLSSTEHQTVVAFLDIMDIVRSLHALAGPLSRQEALGRLRSLCEEARFQPGGAEDAPVQAMGVLEAAGLPLDRLWLLSLHDEVWPRAPRPNPLLPVRLQRRLGMPRAGPRRELAFARRVTERLLRAAPEVVASYPRTDEDRSLRPSALTAGLPEVPAGELPRSDIPDIPRSLVGVRLVAEAERPAPLPAGPAPGGTALLRSQAACPFQALARHRLRAAALPAVAPGPDASERGTLVHEALQQLWGRLGSQRGLLEASTEQLDRALAEAAADAVRRLLQRRPAVGPVLAAMERERLKRLLGRWLEEVDRPRPPFGEVRPEQRARLRVGGLELEGRADRLDRLPGGGWLVIDYKVGASAPRPASWLGRPPDEPQLPLYALALGAEAAGLAFARVRPEERRLQGLGREALAAGIAPLPGEGWSAQLEQWREDLEALAAAVRRGTGEVAPRHGAATCRLCDLRPLCRISEIYPDSMETADPPEEEP